jgi:hypothetical protein
LIWSLYYGKCEILERTRIYENVTINNCVIAAVFTNKIVDIFIVKAHDAVNIAIADESVLSFVDCNDFFVVSEEHVLRQAHRSDHPLEY